MKGLRREFPREIYIKGNAWRIVFKKHIDHPCADDEIIRGLCDGDQRIIFLRVGMSPKDRRETFFHELFHAIDFEYKLRISHKLIYRMEGPVAEVFRQNCWITWADWQGSMPESED